MIVNRKKLLQLAPIKDMRPIKVHGNMVSHGMSEAGYDIRIKQDILFVPFRNRHRDKEEAFQTTLAYAHHYVGGNKGLGNFCLGSTIEEFQMPMNLVGIVHDKSTWARKGLSVFNTVIEPGWQGFLTVELVYHGQEQLFIPAGSGIAQVVFHETTDPAMYDGKYQNQADMPVEAILSH